MKMCKKYQEKKMKNIKERTNYVNDDDSHNPFENHKCVIETITMILVVIELIIIMIMLILTDINSDDDIDGDTHDDESNGNKRNKNDYYDTNNEKVIVTTIK